MPLQAPFPKEFVFSGSCILSVQPADADAIVLEIAQKQSQKEDQLLPLQAPFQEAPFLPSKCHALVLTLSGRLEAAG